MMNGLETYKYGGQSASSPRGPREGHENDSLCVAQAPSPPVERNAGGALPFLRESTPNLFRCGLSPAATWARVREPLFFLPSALGAAWDVPIRLRTHAGKQSAQDVAQRLETVCRGPSRHAHRLEHDRWKNPGAGAPEKFAENAE